MGDLLPCPFCGSGTINLVAHRGAGHGPDHAGDDVWTIGCYECGGSVPGRYNEHGKGLLIAAWNRRAIPAADARAEALKEALQALRGAGSFGRTAAEKHAALEQYCLCRDAILALIAETKPSETS